MKRIFSLMFLILALTTCAFAQEKATADKPEPKLLTPAQSQQLIEANKVLLLIQTELELAKQRLATVQAQNDSMIKGFFIDLGLDGKRYGTRLEIIDPRTDKVGFLPIPEPLKEETKPQEKKN